MGWKWMGLYQMGPASQWVESAWDGSEWEAPLRNSLTLHKLIFWAMVPAVFQFTMTCLQTLTPFTLTLGKGGHAIHLWSSLAELTSLALVPEWAQEDLTVLLLRKVVSQSVEWRWGDLSLCFSAWVQAAMTSWAAAPSGCGSPPSLTPAQRVYEHWL